jgi:hypothetical protein
MDIRTNFYVIPDPRIKRGKKHLLVDILFICIIAMAYGVEKGAIWWAPRSVNWPCFSDR